MILRRKSKSLFFAITLCVMLLVCSLHNPGAEAADNGAAVPEGEKTSFLTPEAFGAAGDGVTDDTAAIQAMFNSCVGESVATFRSGATYILTDTITVKRFTSVDGNGCTFKMLGNAFSVSGFCFALNTDGLSELSVNHKYKQFFSNCYIEADENYYGDHNGIVCANHVTIDHVTFNAIDIVIKFTDDYIDMCEVKDLYIRRRQGDNYAIYSGKYGDGRKFSRIQQGAGSNTNLLYIGNGHQMVTVSEIVGKATIRTGSPTHFEQIMLSYQGRIIVDGADCSFNNVYASLDKRTESVVEINPRTVKEIVQEPHFRMSNCFFYVTANNQDEHTANPIKINGCRSFCFENVLTGASGSSVTAVAKSYAAVDSNLIEIELYNRFPQALDGKHIVIGQPLSFTASAGGLLEADNPSVSSDILWSEKIGIYYYYRLETRPDSEITQGCCSDELAVFVDSHKRGVKFLSRNENGFEGKKIRIYRGTRPGVYSLYADLFVINNCIYDTGNSVNGILWRNTDNSVSRSVGDWNIESIDYHVSNGKIHRVMRSASGTDISVLGKEGLAVGDAVSSYTAPFDMWYFDGEKWTAALWAPDSEH